MAPSFSRRRGALHAARKLRDVSYVTAFLYHLRRLTTAGVFLLPHPRAELVDVPIERGPCSTRQARAQPTSIANAADFRVSMYSRSSSTDRFIWRTQSHASASRSCPSQQVAFSAATGRTSGTT